MISVGIDEVGRGCWAGPLVAGAVILNQPIPGLKDSKKLTKSQRETLAAEVNIHALAVGLGWVWPADIDTMGVTHAVKMAMELALQELADESYDEVIIDGNYNFFPDNPKAKAIVKADDSVPAVSAASIVAKVARDKYMSELTGDYLNYDFAKHVGYGTALHLELLKKYGVSDIHRRSYKPVRALIQ